MPCPSWSSWSGTLSPWHRFLPLRTLWSTRLSRPPRSQRRWSAGKADRSRGQGSRPARHKFQDWCRDRPTQPRHCNSDLLRPSPSFHLSQDLWSFPLSPTRSHPPPWCRPLLTCRLWPWHPRLSCFPLLRWLHPRWCFHLLSWCRPPRWFRLLPGLRLSLDFHPLAGSHLMP
jgi:hypothetical protein